MGRQPLLLEVAFGGEVVSGDSQQVYRRLDIKDGKAGQRSKLLFLII